MAYPPGMELHGSAWRITKRVPQDLLGHYAPKKLLRFTTGESNKKAAALKGWRWLAEMEEEFHRLRTTGSPHKRVLSDHEASHLIGLALHSRTQADEELRSTGLDDLDWSRLQESQADAEERERLAISRGQLSQTAIHIVHDWLLGHGYDIPKESPEFRAFALRFHKAMSGATRIAKQRNVGEWIETPPRPVAYVPESHAELRLSEVISSFLEKQDKDAPMYRKYAGTLSLLLEVWCDRPVSGIKQKDVDDFFALVCKLPPRWTDEKRKRNLSAPELAALKWDKTISPKTFEDGYMAGFRPFLEDSIRLYGDQGFPRHLTTKGIKYSGDEEEGEKVQRALTPEEVRRLFEGPEFSRFAASPELEHCYWLPLIGLYTGARVNEVCQLNPQCDIREEGGIWFFDITEESEGDERIRKSVKNISSKRSVPIHSRLVELGFLDYVERMKNGGHQLLFPQWSPRRGKASGAAEKWFREFLRKAGLRDDTPGARVVGFHAFRHTFLNRAMNLDVTNAEWLTGHAPESVSAVVRRYQGRAALVKKQDIMEQIVFDVSPPAMAR